MCKGHKSIRERYAGRREQGLLAALCSLPLHLRALHRAYEGALGVYSTCSSPNEVISLAPTILGSVALRS